MFGIRISSIEVSKQKLCSDTSHTVYNITYNKEILTRRTSFLENEGIQNDSWKVYVHVQVGLPETEVNV